MRAALVPLLLALASDPPHVRVTDDAPWHVHTGSFSVRVESERDARARWVDGFGAPLGDEVSLRAGREVRLPAPDVGPGHRTLEVRAGDATERFGFTVLPKAPPARLDPLAVLGVIHLPPDLSVPFEGFLKTSSWQWSGERNADTLRAARARGLEEVLLLHGRDWDSPDRDATPLTAAALDALGARLGRTLDAIRDAGLAAPRTIQAGVEVNAGDVLARPAFLANLARKLERVRAELDARGMDATEVMLHTRGTSPPALAELRTILESDAGAWADRLGHSLYDFEGGWRLPLEDRWVDGAVEALRTVVAQTRPGMPVDVAEFGCPANAPEGARLGYPRADGSFDEVRWLGPAEQARYLVESAVVALDAGAERFFHYHVLARAPEPGDDPRYAENFFGLIADAGADERGARRPGFPFPGLTALAALHRHLAGRDVTERRTVDGVVVFELWPRPGREGSPRLVAWSLDDREHALRWSRLREGLAERDVRSVEDLFGALLARQSASLAVGPWPVWVAFDAPRPASLAPRGTVSIDHRALSDGRIALRGIVEGAPHPTEWRWDFGDGTRSATRAPVHAFARAGTTTVTLEVRSGDAWRAEARAVLTVR